jgi:hypothetical protein
MKFKLSLFLAILSLANIFGDESADRNQTNATVKFRGKVEIGFGYYFDMWQGNANDKAGDFLYQKMDFTNQCDPSNRHHTDNTGRSFGGPGGEETGAFLQYSIISACFAGSNSLTSGNNLRINFNSKITPVSTGAGMDFVLTPVAFYYFSLGFYITGAWNIPALGAIGVAENVKGDPASPGYGGPILDLTFENTLQFDLSYVFGAELQRWTHVLFLASAIIKYRALLTVSDNVPFFYENDRGENLNGWKFDSNFIIGYKIPVIEDDAGSNGRFIRLNNNNFAVTLAFAMQIDTLELTHYDDSPMNRNGWGSDFVPVKFSPVINFDFPRNFYLLVQFRFANSKRVTDATVGNKFYQDRIYEDYYIYFNRVAFMFGWKF